MKKFMKTWVFCTLAVVAMCGCSEGFDDGADWNEQQIAETRTATATDVVYHEGTESCLVPRNDPYTLANFRQALSNLKQGRSTQTLTTAQSAAIAQVADLSATHYALKIYPRTESEQWAISRMEDIQISYTPFDYVMLPKEQSDALRAAKSSIPTHPDVSRYTVTYENMRTVEGPVSAQSFDMPVMYVVWPCSKPLPQGYDYEIDYEVYLPSYDSAENGNVATQSAATVDANVLHSIENEAVRLAWGTNLSKSSNVSDVITISGGIAEADDYLNTTVPLANLKIQFNAGSRIFDTYTLTDGSFSITNTIPIGSTIKLVFQHPKWKVTTEDSTSPYVYYHGVVDDIYDGVMFFAFALRLNECPVCEVHRAVNYYYHGSHNVRKWSYNDGEGIRLIASRLAHEDPNVCGNFYARGGENNKAYITVYNVNRIEDNKVIGTTLHELGHFTHFGERGGYDEFFNVHMLLIESFAPYVGWYLGEKYYTSLGATFLAIDNITGESRQTWRKDFNSEYSPLFVDLIDNYNQNTYSYSCNVDVINGVSHSIIREIAETAETLGDVKTILLAKSQSNAINFTQQQITQYIAPYEYWLSNYMGE